MTTRLHLTGALTMAIIVAIVSALASHPEPSTERKLGPMPWEEGFIRND
jgi:hypothetical protein